AHSLKGLSGMFGFDAMSDLAHHLEDLLDALRMGRLPLSDEGLGLFDDSITVIADALGETDDPEQVAATESRIRGLVERIESWNAAPDEDAVESDSLHLSPSVLRALTEYEEHRLQENLNRGRGIYVVDVDFEIASFEEGLAEVSAAIKEIGEILSTLPSPGDTPDSHIRFSLLTATDLAVEDLAARLDLSVDAVEVGRLPRAADADPDPAPAVDSKSENAEPKVEPEVVVGPEASPEQPGHETTTLKSISDTVRVDIKKLDELMNLVGELAIQKGAIKQMAMRMSGEKLTERAGSELDKIHRALERKLQELQAGVLEVRMVPLRQVFDKLARVVRRLRLDLRKDVQLEIRGADTELDKLIVEELVDPLMHVVRNAFDHAIESEEERLEIGKPANGTIRVEALQRGNDVVIAVSDDGRGIDADHVLALAHDRGLVSREADLSRKEILELIFQPGLSTREEVTETSGRGVGMDVVRSNIASMGGIVDIDSTPQLGTTITITLPITLAIIQALIVGVGEHLFAVPLNSVRETLLVDPAEIQRSEGRELLNLRGDPLALRRLAEEFHLEGDSVHGKPYVVVLGMGDARMGLLVDRLEGQQDTVIKPIQGPIREVRGIAGATELGEQGAVLVLDVSALVEDLGRRSDP
ncbi:MAG: chemotaxis protein CheA, partial [Deltaproteobacteria bacterium]|nr:chemotaxis protein CheA [Deltaproteobacteria bacterium]